MQREERKREGEELEIQVKVAGSGRIWCPAMLTHRNLLLFRVNAR